MDSLDAVELAIAAERQFNVGLSDEQVAKLKTVADIVALVQRLIDGAVVGGGLRFQLDLLTRPGSTRGRA